ncbi:hypothetical protein ES702_03203 [subsurface metagenome]
MNFHGYYECFHPQLLLSGRFHVTEGTFCDAFLVAKALLTRPLAAFFVQLLSEHQLAKRISAAIDATSPVTRNFALGIVQPAEGYFNAGQICLIWDHLKGNFSYVSDPRRFEFISPASETIKAGLAGDCDDVATLTVALIESVGGVGRVVSGHSIWGNHAYAECFVGDGEHVRDVILPVFWGHYPGMGPLHCHVDAVGNHWMNLDVLSGCQYAGDAFFEATRERAFYRDGFYESIS